MKGKDLEKYLSVPGFEKITFGEILDTWGKTRGDKIAVKDRMQTITYAELAEKSQMLTGRLRAIGIEKDSIVALQCTNEICFVAVFFALLYMGAVPIMILPAYREQEIVRMMQKAEAKAYIGPVEYLGYGYDTISTAIKREIPEAVTLLIDDTFVDAEKSECTEDAVPSMEAGIAYDDIAVLLLSGGTTGEPKLIPRTHGDYIYNARVTAERSCLGSQSVYLASLSIAHNMPLACPGLLGTLYAGGTVVLSYYSSPDEILELIEEEEVTVMGIVPTLAQLCMELQETDEYDLSSLEVIITGGARLEPEIAEEIIASFGCVLQNQFGTAEGLVMSTALRDPVEWTMKYQGRPASEAEEIILIDEAGRPVPEGESGELVVKGPCTIESYYHEPHLTDKFTADGYYRTGDRAVIAECGNVCVLGRMKEQINRAGEKIQPSEIEENLMKLEGIQKAVALAVPDELLGQRSCAFIQLKSGYAFDKNRICAILQQKGIVHYKIPDQIEVIEEWPITKVGKVDINELRRKAENCGDGGKQ